MRSGKPKDLESSSRHGRERSHQHVKTSGVMFPDGKSIPSLSRIRISPKRHSSASVDSPTGNSLRNFLNKFIDCKSFTHSLRGWLRDKLPLQELHHSPFQLKEIQEFDLALEGVQFQQIIRMPNLSLSSSFSSSLSVASFDRDTCLALEDFLHTSVQNLWGTFWKSNGTPPFFITGSHGIFSKNASREGPASKSFKESQCVALVGKFDAGARPLWEHILQFVLLKPNLRENTPHENVFVPSPTVAGQAIFYALHMLFSRKMANGKSAVIKDPDVAYVLLVDSQYGGVVRVQGDINGLDINSTNVYEAASTWVEEKARVAISPIERVWNRLGNANWGDYGALQLLLATFHCIEQCIGPSKKSITELATNYIVQLQSRKIEHKTVETHENGTDVVSSRPSKSHGEIVEIEEEIEPDVVKELEIIKLDRGSVIWLEDSQWQSGIKILDNCGGSRQSVYTGIALDEGDKLLNVYIGAHPSQQKVCWDYMGTWYQVQRQTRVLNLMKQRGVSSKYLPQLIASGRILHPGTCMKQSPGGQCGHPWCGTPVLVTVPVGVSLGTVIRKHGVFTPVEALRCCRDSLSCLQSANSVGIQHGDITSEHVILVVGADGEKYHVLIGWGHAIIEDRDSPGISLQFSSTSALQEGKLCPASDAESLVYLLYFLCGGSTPQFDSIESALQWRERSWSRRSIQQQLGETSALLKAFADYVDSLCGTPYPVDYEIWLRRLNRALKSEDSGKRMEDWPMITRTDDLAESSGTSGGSLD